MSENQETLNQTSTEAGKRKKYLTFMLEDERYGIPLSSVKEIIGMTEITPIPQVPAFFKGLINLRGKIISVIDLRAKLSLPKAEYQPKKTSIIITEIEDIVIGTIVDDVTEVVGFQTEQIDDHINIQSKISKDFITGVAKIQENKLVLLLDIAKVLSAQELNIIRKK